MNIFNESNTELYKRSLEYSTTKFINDNTKNNILIINIIEKNTWLKHLDYYIQFILNNNCVVNCYISKNQNHQ